MQLVAYRRTRRREAEREAELAATRRLVEELERRVLEQREVLDRTAIEIERILRGSS
jgi:Trp operon repressor